MKAALERGIRIRVLVSDPNSDLMNEIEIRKNASTKAKGCPLRRDEVLLIRKLGYERWKQLKDAGRWIAEIVCSSLKRVLGEDLLSRKFKAQKIEAGLSNVIQQIHQLIIEQQLSQNNITLYFAAIKLQATLGVLLPFSDVIEFILRYIKGSRIGKESIDRYRSALQSQSASDEHTRPNKKRRSTNLAFHIRPL
jgi:hypothetical protein